MVRIQQNFGDIPFAYISVKPSILRWGINDRIKYTNQLIADEIKKHNNAQFLDIYSQMTDEAGYPKRELFMADGLHLNAKGYDIWRSTVLKYLQNL